MVILVVIRLHVLPGHLRDVLGQTAVAVAQSCAGEGQVVGMLESHPLQRHGALHLGIHHALIGQFAVQILQVVMPGLGAEDAFIGHDQRMEAGIHVEIRQLQQLLLRQRRQRVAGAGVGGVRVHVGVIGLIADIEKQRSGRILVRTKQRSMLEHVRQTRIIIGSGREGELEKTVGILIGDPEELGAGTLMLE